MDKEIQIKKSTLKLDDSWSDELVERFQQEKTEAEVQDMSLQDFLMNINNIEKELYQEEQEIKGLLDNK